ncbi:MAG TPA: hypothetical protein ENI43_00680 [Firmicutes bacterium]|nr:hypothetical protein [Bacillota bacterium]
MRKLIVAIAAVGLIGSFSATYAMSVGAGGGYIFGMPMGDFSDGFKPSMMNFGGGVCIGVMPMMSIDGGFEYHLNYKNKELGLIEEGTYKLQMMVFGAGARINFIPEGSFRPYAGGGFNFYMMKYKNADGEVPEGVEDVSKPGVYFGGGVGYFITEAMAINAPVKLHMIFTEEEKTMLLTFGAGIEYYFM